MSQAAKDTKRIIKGDEARKALLEGARLVAETVGVTYGPKGRNVLIEKTYGRPVLTRDGVTVAREVYFRERDVNMGAQAVLEASETTNRIAGDGTSATSILAYSLMKHGVQAIAAGTHPMDIKATLLKDSQTLLDKLDELSATVSEGQLNSVATVSAGDPVLGKLISEAIEYVGPDGGILTEKSPIDTVERKYEDGYYLQSGFTALTVGKKEMINPKVVISTRRLSSAADVLDILNGVARTMVDANGQLASIPRILFVGNIEDAAYLTIVENINQGRLDGIIIKTPPTFGEMGKDLLEDIAILCDCETITDSTNLKNFVKQTEHGVSSTFIGSIDKVVASKNDSTLFRAKSGETVKDRVDALKDQLKATTVDAITEKLKDRIAKLEGKIALFKIGAPTETAKEEIEFRVEDAIQATRAAASDGIVPGGGVTLLELSKQDISDTYREALHDVFKRLLVNANLSAEVKLLEALEAPTGFGYNLREGDELVDVVKAGVLDPTLVVSEVIKNATEVAAGILTTETLLTFVDREENVSD